MAAALIAASAPSASAATHINGAFYSGYAQITYTQDRHGGMVGFFDVSIKRGMAYKSYTEMICDYQAMVTLTLPSGYTYKDESSFHEGCNGPEIPGWFKFPSYGTRSNHDDYPRGSEVRYYWRDNHTDGEYKTAWKLTL